MTENDITHWRASLDDLLLHRWELSSATGRSRVINTVERLMNSEIIEFTGIEPPKVAEANVAISKALELAPDDPMVLLLSVIAKAMPETKPDKREQFFISAE